MEDVPLSIALRCPSTHRTCLNSSQFKLSRNVFPEFSRSVSGSLYQYRPPLPQGANEIVNPSTTSCFSAARSALYRRITTPPKTPTSVVNTRSERSVMRKFLNILSRITSRFSGRRGLIDHFINASFVAPLQPFVIRVRRIPIGHVVHEARRLQPGSHC